MAKYLVLIRNLNGKVKYMVFENKDIAEHYAHKMEQDASNCAETLELDEEI
ncbi:MAG: hypothetical protein KAW87_05170 [Candidatus Cloacimonetes bacterium]|nr:hypothetical protein [Candidatus Cloacimonadota bacterium]